LRDFAGRFMRWQSSSDDDIGDCRHGRCGRKTGNFGGVSPIHEKLGGSSLMIAAYASPAWAQRDSLKRFEAF